MEKKYFELSTIDEDTFIVSSTVNRKTVKLGKREVNFLLSLTGNEIKEEKDDSEIDLTDEQKEYLVSKYTEWGFLDGRAISEKMTLSNIVLFRIQAKEKVLRVLSHLISKVGLVGAMLTTILALFIIGSISTDIANVLLGIRINLLLVVMVYVTNFIIAVSHELCHSAACYKYTGKSSKMGIKLFYFLPAFFCDVSGIYLAGSRKKSLYVSSAGLFCNLVYANISLILYYLILNFCNKSISVLVIIWAVNLVNIICNLFPFAKYDGYWILKSVLGIENLYDKSINLFFDSFLDRKSFQENDITGSKKYGATIYGAIVYISHWVLWIGSAVGIYYLVEKLGIPYVAYVCALIVMLIGLRDCVKFTIKYSKGFNNNIHQRGGKGI